MKQTMRRFVVLVPVFFLLIPTLDARIYRWVDDHGVVHYSTTPPPAASDREMRILDHEGRERAVRPAPLTPEQRAREAEASERERLDAEQRQRELEQRQAEAIAQQARARQLHAAYANVDEIKQQRDRRLQMVETTLRLSERQEATLQGEIERIAGQMLNTQVSEATMQRYRDELADLESRIEREWAFQRRQRDLHAEINANAEADIRDFEALVVREPR